MAVFVLVHPAWFGGWCWKKLAPLLEAVFDLISAQRRPAMEAMVESEGFGWLLPRYAAQPWEEIARQAWQVTD
ncbi:MAG TPA: hypothetical protein VHS30_34285, partial [Streptosporangiaceae bacterium]|nr:hypothetical protein [Streptosporangiaceae bacterium]